MDKRMVKYPASPAFKRLPSIIKMGMHIYKRRNAQWSVGNSNTSGSISIIIHMEWDMNVRAGLEAVLTIGICHLHKKRDISKLIPVITAKRLQCSTDSLCNCVLIPTYTPCQIASKSDELGLGTYLKMCSTGGSCLIFALYSAACASYSAFSASDSCSYAAFLISRESFKFPSVGVRPRSDSSDFKVIESWL
jgi:hypothetical protein